MASPSKDQQSNLTAREAFNASGIRAALDADGKLAKSTSADVIADYMRVACRSVADSGPLERSTLRELLVAVGVKASQADAAFTELRRETEIEGLVGSKLDLSDPEPWPAPVDGADLLDAIAAVFRRHLALPNGAASLLALWTLFAHVHDSFAVSPMMAFVSAVRGSGKTTALTLLSAILTRPMFASNLTGPVLFRAVERYRPSLLIDEADTILRDREDLRTILNASHSRRTATVPRTVGDEHEPRLFSTFCPKVIAMIGNLPATLYDRSLVIRMSRRKPDEEVESIRLDRLDSEYGHLRQKAIRWADDNRDHLRLSDPRMPAQLRDRPADNARPLLAVADAAGGEWHKIGRAVLVANLTRLPEDDPEERLLLLSDLREIFTNHGRRLRTAEIISVLAQREDRSWGEWRRGSPLTGLGLAKLLKPFGVRPRTLRFPTGTAKGYELENFNDLFERYLPEPQGLIGNTRNNPRDSTTNHESLARDVGADDTSKGSEGNPHKSVNVTDVTGQGPPPTQRDERSGTDEQLALAYI